MKNGKVLKNSSVLDGELELINKYSRRDFSEDEVYVFSVVLCDNDVDRDGERFTVESLEKLAELFVGVTGIFDHNPKAGNQTARIISCRVENVPDKKNKMGDDLFRLVARAYMPVTDGNRELRLSIDSGIVREVSVGCAVEKTICSICGEEIGACPHIKGETYGSRLCCGELINPTDAYEFSFVAVPAQKGAGVIKAFSGKELHMTDILKSIENNEELTLNKSETKKLSEYISELKKKAADGMVYRNSLETELLRLSAIVQPEITRATMMNVAKSLTVGELKEFNSALEKSLGDKLPVKPQLYTEKADKTDNNTEFKI